MAFNPATDFLAMFRNTGLSVVKERMPSLDVVVAALGRTGLITVTTSGTAPVANQATTAWFKPAVPSYSGEGVLYLWDPVNTVYAPASAALLWDLLLAASNSLGTSWYIVAGGPPANTVGNNGDYSIRSDFPGGLYGPKTAGAWPAQPLPGSTYAVDSTALDATFGTAPGSLIYRGGTQWQALGIGAGNGILTSSGAAPAWATLTSILDGLLGTALRGSMLFRNATQWLYLNPGTAGYNLVTNGPGADPSWSVPGAEFASGTVMVFRQTAAPLNWTKQTAINDAGLRVTSGAVSNGGSVAFSTLFGTTTVGNTTLTVATMPSHGHPNVANGQLGYTSPGGATNVVQALVIGSTGNTGGDGAHAHALDMRLSYADVIIATKN